MSRPRDARVWFYGISAAVMGTLLVLTLIYTILNTPA